MINRANNLFLNIGIRSILTVENRQCKCWCCFHSYPLKGRSKKQVHDFFLSKKGLKRRQVRYLFENGETWEIITFITNKQKKRKWAFNREKLADEYSTRWTTSVWHKNNLEIKTLIWKRAFNPGDVAVRLFSNC